LGHILAHLEGPEDPDLLVGFDTSDDAGVYRVGEKLALVQTVDIITPVCDDPRLFGRIAAANSLSDVYAMGGRPVTAMNICCFPGEGVPDGVYHDILSGALEAILEAGAALVGGHTVRDRELKYGLSVTGLIDPSRILRNAGARPGDALVLTKPIGTGVLINGARKDRVPQPQFQAALTTMARLNAKACAAALAHDATACTDVTGFGLAGHALEMARGGGVRLIIRAMDVPVFDGSRAMVEAGVTTAMTSSNRTLASGAISFDSAIDETSRTLFFDPQTSGGLLIALPASRAVSLVAALHAAGDGAAALIGEVARGDPSLEVV